MDFTKLVPSRELCEEMASLGICQDWAELWLVKLGITGENIITDKADYADIKGGIIAPMLPRMIEELPKDGYAIVIQPFEDVWSIRNLMTRRVDVEDKHLPNAVAKALIAIKRGDK